MNTIDKLQNDLSLWYAASPINQFMHWWKTELKSFVPQKYKQQLFPATIKVYLTQDAETMTVWYSTNNNLAKYTDTTTTDGTPEQWWHQVQNIINEADGKKVSVEYLLSNDEALIRKIALPQAAKENLDEVIGFELDKYVPFNQEQVQLGYKIDQINTNEDKILLDLAVVPKQAVADVLNLCDDKSISLDGIDVNLMDKDTEPQYLGVNLLPAENRKPRNYFNLKLNLALSLVLMALIYFVMHTSLANKQNKIERLTEINSILQQQARTSKLLRKELKEVIVSSKFLQNKKHNHPALVTILSEVTTILPDHTYLTRLKISQENLEITGQSDNANSLVPKLDESTNWYVPQIVGGITPDSRTNKEKFTIKADLKEPQIETEDDSNT
ncbi:hypothetical protein MNBD_GAMMA01-2183 [hydrothermal vent metagenome]|uniref:General secretion pathway protein L n=1 Tax=hydrothermal vent metagenome TaxID=652676 RepID=A0A3B0V824_9ZZZZ